MEKKIAFDENIETKIQNTEVTKIREFRALRQWMKQNRPFNPQAPITGDQLDVKLLRM